MHSPSTIKLAELAALLDRSEDWLRRNWLRLHTQHGFPRKHPFSWTWPRAAVDAFLSARPELPVPANDDLPGDPGEAYGRLLEQRYGAGL